MGPGVRLQAAFPASHAARPLGILALPAAKPLSAARLRIRPRLPPARAPSPFLTPPASSPPPSPTQWAATRADLFPPDMCTRLQRLQADAPAHEFWYTRREVETAFNITLEELFETFDEQPVASGSIAQVHRATLRPGFAVPSKPRPFYLELVAPRDKGTLEVAVKVRHPRVADIIARDFAILQFAADIAGARGEPADTRTDTLIPPFCAPFPPSPAHPAGASRTRAAPQPCDTSPHLPPTPHTPTPTPAGIFPGLGWMRLDESVRQFRAPLFEQVDLRQEAQNLATFNSNFKSWKAR